MITFAAAIVLVILSDITVDKFTIMVNKAEYFSGCSHLDSHPPQPMHEIPSSMYTLYDIQKKTLKTKK